MPQDVSISTHEKTTSGRKKNDIPISTIKKTTSWRKEKTIKSDTKSIIRGTT
jgi:hypothetical protein